MQEDDLEHVILTENASHAIPWKINHFLDCIQSHYWNYIFVSTQEPYQILGHCVLMPGVEELHLLNITIHPNCRRMGLATSALMAIENTCKEKKLLKILLEVRKSNTHAILLYEKLKFQTIGYRKDYYPVPFSNETNLREDALVMEKNL